MADLKDRLKEAAEGGVVDAVKNGASSMLGWLWWLIPAAGIFTYFFRDAEWMPKGLMDTLREWMGKLALWLETTFPSLKPFLDKIFGDAAEKAAAAMSAESVRNEFTKDNKFSSEMAQALMPDETAKTELTRIFKKNGSSIASGAAGFTPKVLAGMLTDPEGQKIITRMLPIAAKERKNPPRDSEGKVISGGADLIKNAIKGLLNDSEQFQTVASNPAAMGLLYQGAATISGVAFGEGALQQFVSAAKLTPEAQRLLFAGFIDNPQQALQNIFTNKAIPTSALTALAESIDADKSDEKLREDIKKFKNLAKDTQKLDTTRTIVSELGKEVVEAFGKDPVGTLVAQSTKENPITGAKLAALAVAGGDAKNPLIKALQDKTTADQVITLVKTMEAQRTGSFTNFAGIVQSADLNTPQGRARIINYINQIDPQESQIIKNFLQQSTLLTNDVKTNLSSLLSQPREAIAAQVKLVADSKLTQADIDALQAAAASFKANGNAQPILSLLMQDDFRSRLVTGADDTIDVDRPIQQIRTVIAAHNSSKAIDLAAIYNLAVQIDKNTGNDNDANAEKAADAANAKAMNFMIQLATGKKPAADRATIQAISTLFSKKENVDAFQTFLNNLDLNTLPPQQRAFVKVLKDNWYIDRNHNGQFDAANALLSLDSGLAAFLAHRASAGVILEQATGRLGSFGDWMNVPVNFLTDPSLKAIREAAAKLEVASAQAVTTPTQTVIPPVVAAANAPARQ